MLETPDGIYWTCHGHGTCNKTLKAETEIQLKGLIIEHLKKHMALEEKPEDKED